MLGYFGPKDGDEEDDVPEEPEKEEDRAGLEPYDDAANEQASNDRTDWDSDDSPTDKE